MPKQNTAPSDYPQAVLQQIEQLAQNIVTARKRRKETQAQWAQRLGVSQPTMARIERGDPAVAMASYVMCLWLVNQAHGLAELIAPQNDHTALEREVARTRTRRKPAARAAIKKVEKRAASDNTESPVSPPASGTRFIETSATSARAEQDFSSAVKKAMRIATTDPRLELEKAMRNAGIDQNSALEEAMRSAGMDLGGTNPNGTAAGLASLIFGSKKAHP